MFWILITFLITPVSIGGTALLPYLKVTWRKGLPGQGRGDRPSCPAAGYLVR